MDFDEMTKKLGQFGRYQKFIFLMLCLVEFPAAFNIMGIVFIAGVPEHWCQSMELFGLNLTNDVMRNITIPLVERDGQSLYSSCSRYVYDVAYDEWTMDDVKTSMLTDRANLSTETCPHGWNYADDQYESTIVSQVVTYFT